MGPAPQIKLAGRAAGVPLRATVTPKARSMEYTMSRLRAGLEEGGEGTDRYTQHTKIWEHREGRQEEKRRLGKRKWASGAGKRQTRTCRAAASDVSRHHLPRERREGTVKGENKDKGTQGGKGGEVGQGGKGKEGEEVRQGQKAEEVGKGGGKEGADGEGKGKKEEKEGKKVESEETEVDLSLGNPPRRQARRRLRSVASFFGGFPTKDKTRTWRHHIPLLERPSIARTKLVYILRYHAARSGNRVSVMLRSERL